jgi:hypothetical protein
MHAEPAEFPNLREISAQEYCKRRGLQRSATMFGGKFGEKVEH